MGIRDTARNHVGVCVAALAAITFATASCVVRCDAVHRHPVADPTPEQAVLAGEPTRFAALREDYDATTAEALALLRANTWVDGTGTTMVRFTGECIETRTQGDDTWEPFAIVASERLDEASLTILCISGDGWDEILTLTAHRQVTPSAPPAPATLTCAGIAGGSVLTASRDLRELTLEGPPQAILEAHGTTSDEIGSALASWCADWRPTATCATWEQTITEDHEARVTRIHYTLDDKRQSAVTVEIGMDDHGVEVREGRR